MVVYNANNNAFGVIGYTFALEYFEFVQLYYWYSVGISLALIVFAYAIHIRSLKQLWNGIKATPKAILYSLLQRIGNL